MRFPSGLAVRFDGGVSPLTVTLALFETAPTAAVTLPLPGVVPAVNVVDEPVAGETEPPGTFVDQAAPDTLTGFEYWSAPLAVNTCVPPTLSEALLGESVIVASAAAVTVSAWLALVAPLALAVTVALPAFVSR
jgi:hypothetical protein